MLKVSYLHQIQATKINNSKILVDRVIQLCLPKLFKGGGRENGKETSAEQNNFCSEFTMDLMG